MITTASWPRHRADAAHRAVECLDTADSGALLDGLAWRIERMGTTQDPEVIAGLRYSVTLLLAELGKRHGEE